MTSNAFKNQSEGMLTAVGWPDKGLVGHYYPLCHQTLHKWKTGPLGAHSEEGSDSENFREDITVWPAVGFSVPSGLTTFVAKERWG